MAATITAYRVSSAIKVRGVGWYGGFDIRPAAPPAGPLAMDIADAAVRRLAMAASLIAAAFAGAGLALASVTS